MKNLKAVICSVIVGLTLIISSNCFLNQDLNSKEEKRKNDITIFITDRARIIEKTINSTLNSAHTLEHVVNKCDNTSNYNALAEDIMKKYPGIVRIDFAPKGVITDIYPLHENKQYVGTNLFNEEAFSKEANDALKKKEFILADLNNTNTNRCVGILPVFNMNSKGEEYFWGFINVHIDVNYFFRSSCFQCISKNGYSFSLYKINNYGKKLILTSCTNELKEPIYTNMIILDKVWQLGVSTQNNVKKTFPMIFRISSIIVSCIVSAIVYLFLKQHLDLCKEVEERKEIEKALRKSEKKYHAFFDMCPDYIYVINIDEDKVIEANPALLKKLGLSLKEFQNMEFTKFLSSEFLKIGEDACKKLKSGKILKDLDFVILDTQNNEIYLEVNCIPISEFNEVKKVLCVARDVTERKRINEIKEKSDENIRLLNEAIEYDKLKTEFFANISHELRTPLNVILSSLQMLDLYLNNERNIIHREKIDKYRKNMKQNCFRLLRLISNLIDVTKVDAGYLELNLKNNDIVYLVENITLSIIEYAESKQLTIEFDTEIEEKIILCDSEKIERIMLNLLSNSIKFTKPGDKINVYIKDKKDSIEISVKDTGIGIPEDKIDIIFERFRQVNKSFTREHEGSGIGLALVKSLVELHGGTIQAKSVLGKGSEFIIALPVKEVAHSEVACGISDTKDIGNSDMEKINIEFSDIYFD